MAMTVLITTNVEDRYRGFIRSCMPEIDAGLYASNSLSSRARDRLWEILLDWHRTLQNGSLVLIYLDKKAPSGLQIKSVGVQNDKYVDLDGILVVVKNNSSS